MFDRVTEFKVLNAKKVISDALIGSFRFDLGLVYKERDHCFIHKWLLLSDPNDPSGEAKVKTWLLNSVHNFVYTVSIMIFRDT